jgi:hypothetical protein
VQQQHNHRSSVQTMFKLCHSFHSLQSRRVSGENHWRTSFCTLSTSTVLGYVIRSFISFIAITTRKWRKSLAHIHLYTLSTSTVWGCVIRSFVHHPFVRSSFTSFIAITTRKWGKSLAHIHLYHLLIHRTFAPPGIESCPRGSRLSSCRS